MRNLFICSVLACLIVSAGMAQDPTFADFDSTPVFTDDFNAGGSPGPNGDWIIDADLIGVLGASLLAAPQFVGTLPAGLDAAFAGDPVANNPSGDSAVMLMGNLDADNASTFGLNYIDLADPVAGSGNNSYETLTDYRFDASVYFLGTSDTTGRFQGGLYVHAGIGQADLYRAGVWHNADSGGSGGGPGFGVRGVIQGADPADGSHDYPTPSPLVNGRWVDMSIMVLGDRIATVIDVNGDNILDESDPNEYQVWGRDTVTPDLASGYPAVWAVGEISSDVKPLFVDDVALYLLPPPPPPPISFAGANFGIITQEEIETMLGITFEGDPGIAMALDSDDSSLILMTDPSSSLGVVGRLVDLDPVAGTATLVATEAELIAGSQNASETDQDISGIVVSGDIIYLLDSGGDEHQILAVDRSGGLPVTSANISVVNAAPIAETGNFDSQLALIGGEFIIGDPGTGNFIAINATTGAQTVALTSAQVLTGTGGTGSGFNAAGPVNYPGASVFVWNDSDFDGGTGNLYVVDPSGPTFTERLAASASPGGDPDMSQLAIDSEGVIYTWGSFIGDSTGEALQVVEADGTHHIFTDDIIATQLGIDPADIGFYGRGVAVTRDATEVTVYWSTSDSGGDVFSATFGTSTPVQSWEIYR
jgi:hypothetical protein